MQGHPTLPPIRIARPCSSSWELMEGDDRVRHCTNCQRSVYSSAGITVPELVELIEAREQRVCLRLLRRGDGTIITAECTLTRALAAQEAGSAQANAWRMAAWALGVLGVGAAVLILLADRLPHASYTETGDIDIIDSNL